MGSPGKVNSDERADFSMRSHGRAYRKTCEQYERIGGTAAGCPDTARRALRGEVVAVEAL